MTGSMLNRPAMKNMLGVIHKERLARNGIFRPPLSRVSSLNDKISLKMTVGVLILRIFLERGEMLTGTFLSLFPCLSQLFH